MATKRADSGGVKSNRCSNPSRKVRLICKIRGLTDRESEKGSLDSKPWITVKKSKEDGSSERSTVFLESQSTSKKDGYELDCCYEQHEEINNLYSREIQPLVTEVFNGRNASIVAMGAKGSGKTYTIQGSQEKPGLAMIAMSEILSKAKELGKSVSISLYELTQEHVKDLLKSNHPAVQVLEDANGKIILRGLSKVPVKSISEFYTLYLSQVSLKNTQKLPVDQPRNKGLMVHISSEDDKLKAKLTNKINFVDLAGYEDPRKSSGDGTTLVESCKNNKMLHAFLNVVNAINNNETRVPYRESKLSRILQDSLGGTSHALLLTCLNPCFCQDSLSFMSLVSRACIKQVLTDSTNRSHSSVKAKMHSSLASGKALSSSLSAKKQIDHSRFLSANKTRCSVKGRKLFDEVKRVDHKRNQSEDTSTHKSKILPSTALVVAPLSLQEASQETSNYSTVEESEFQSVSELHHTTCDANDKIKMGLSPQSGVSLGTNLTPGVLMPYEGARTFEETNSLTIKAQPQSITERIEEIKNALMCISNPIKPSEELTLACTDDVGSYEIPEPKTPTMGLSVGRHCSPLATFSNCTSGMKNHLVKECINFLNSANKEDLKTLKGIGEKRATYILELREKSPEPFKTLDDLEDIGLSAKQIKGMMKTVAGNIFN